jgi:predicted phosphoadenosine phosphosulfate sulfurtransferase
LKKVKNYTDQDVYTAAKERIAHIIDTFDRVFVSFSGGKDSLAVLKLVEEVYLDRGISRKIDVIFRDEEVIQEDVIHFVEKTMANPRYNFRYYAVRQESIIYVLGNPSPYIQWDNGRRHVRPKPLYAIVDTQDRVHNQNSMDSFLFDGVKGKIAFLQGIRADESLVRLNSVVRKTVDNFITKSKAKNVMICKPIYDWSQKDVFRYFFEKNIEYCQTYDLQIIARKPLRVATALVAESAKHFYTLKTIYPLFYEQIISIWPQMLLQERYFEHLDRDGIYDQYPHSFDGIRKYIRDTQPDKELAKKFTGFVNACEKIRNSKTSDNLGGYPVLHVFRAIVSGSKQMIMAKIKPTKKDIEYEGL